MEKNILSMWVKKTNINILKDFAKTKGGVLLSDEYLNNKQKLYWKCKCGNCWYTSWVDIKYRNSWYPKCSSKIRANKLRKYNYNELNEIIKNKGGILLSNKYINYDNKLNCVCQNNHKFKISVRQIENNQWCPECTNKSNGENNIRKFLKKNKINYISQYSFNNLTGITKRKTKLRFDFYLPEYNILIEYDGK